MSDKPDGTGLTVDLVTKGEWKTGEGEYKRVGGQGVGLIDDASVASTYVVPAGKELRVYLAVCGVWGDAGLLREKEQYAQFDIGVLGGVTIRRGVDGGGVIPLMPPVIVAAGDTYLQQITNRSNHDMSWCVDSYAIEVDV